MATYLVDSNAVGNNDGDAGAASNWANAYTSLLTAIAGKAGGDVFWVDYHHSETLSGHLTFQPTPSPSNRGILIVSVDKASSNIYTPGAAIATGGSANEIRVMGVFRGLSFSSTATISIDQGHYTTFSKCSFSKAAGAFGAVVNQNMGHLVYVDCSFALGASYTLAFQGAASGVVRLIRPTFSGTKGTNATFLNWASGTATEQWFVEDADLSVFDNLTRDNVGSQNNVVYHVQVRRCILPSSYEVDDAQASTLRRAGCELRVIGCDSGTLSVPVLANAIYNFEGYAKTDTAHYRSGGAADGTTSYSLELKAVANRTWKQSNFRAARTMELVGWVTGGASRTVTIYVAHNAVGAGGSGALTNAECWAEIEGPDTAGSATAKGYTATSMCAFDGTAANLTTDGTSSWTGSSIGTKQKISFTFTPTLAGQVIVRVYLAPESGSDVTIYVDPRLEIT